MRRYIIIADDCPPSRQNALTAWLVRRGYEQWHHFPLSWLVRGEVDHQELREQAYTLLDAPVMVFDVTRMPEWRGDVPSDSVPWLQEHFVGG